MLHAVERNQRSRSAQASLAMDGDSSALVLGCSQELGHDVVGWGRSVQEIQIEVLNALFCELILLILCLVEAHH